ncbi:hypothetical protein [Candidatus Uabimicrobium amorphum]|uniref:Uncharacterized protein n=1 Tax=Uabimicrobium amorphum TaxID=2596890 RepID=A0A5S9IIN4_UABAM|nr:hypothetical protein [Candidatus Uabimicrobium amorphum]BBM82513.1 hypothetical protein UABAM_00856 [Candidatus Uabimicrobium amorphum]
MASITCKKCNVAYSDEAKKCPKCQYPTEMNDPFMWFEDDQSKTTEDTVVDRYRATEVEDAAETFTDEAYIGDDYEATVVQDIEEDYYEDSVVETEDNKVYEVPEVMPDVYEMSESEMSENEMSESDYDVYEVSEIEQMPDSYIEDIPDEEEFEEDSWYDDEEADIYEDSQIDLDSGNRSDINPNAWSEEEDLSENQQFDESVAENEKVSRCKCPRCHSTHRFLPISNQYHYEKICEVCREPFRFSLFTLIGEITKENGSSIDYHWQLQAQSKEKVHFSVKEKIDIEENDKVILVYGTDLKSKEEKLSIIATLQGKFFIVENIKRQHDIRGAITAAVLVPLLFIFAYFLHDAPELPQTNLANSTITSKSTNTQNTNTQKTQKNTSSGKNKTPQEKNIQLAIKPKIYAKNGYIYVLGQTNLPSGTQLDINIHKEYGKKVGKATAIVHNETFQALKIPQTVTAGSDGQKEQQLHSGVVIVTLYCDLYTSGKEKSVYKKLKPYVGKYIKKQKRSRGYSKILELKRKVVVSTVNEKKEREQYKLQRWTVKDLSASKKWNANYYVRKLGAYIKYDPTKGDKNVIQCFYFPKANITLVSNLFTGTVVAWRLGKQSE